MTTFITQKVESATAKNGRTYWKVMTDQGQAACFDYPIVQELEKNINKPVSLYDIETNEKGWKTIKFQGKGSKSDKFDEARKTKETTMYVSYAKDIFCSLDENITKETAVDLMNMSCRLVELAKNYFENKTME